MNRLTKLFALTATAAATSLLVTACGGGDASPPPGSSVINAGTTAPAPDTKAPTVTIFDDTPAATATGPVTFTFVFSKDVGASFTASDVVVTGGTAGVFTKVSATQATLLVTPTANTTGTVNVSVAASTFSDLAGNSNSAGATAQQAYNTIVLTQMALPVAFDSASVGYGLVGFGGAEDSTIVADPTNAANKVAKVVRAAGSETYAGTTITATSAAGVQTGLSPKIPFNVTDTRMTLRVWSPDAGIPVRLKVEDSTDPTKSVETEATVTTAGGWQTLTFNFATPSAGTSALNVALNYNKATVFFDFGRAKSAAVLKTYYFDDLTFLPGAVAGGGSCGTTAPTCAPTTAIPAGSTVIYSDAASVTGLSMAPDWGQGTAITRSEVTIASNKSEKYVFTGAPFLYQGIDWTGNEVNVSTKTTLHLDFFAPDITSVKVSIIGGGAESAVTKAVTPGTWNSIDIDLALFTAGDKTKIGQIKLEPATAGTLYVDNIYFYGGTSGGASCGTTTPTCAPTTVIPAGSTVIYSDAASVTGLSMAPDWGQGTSITRSEVTIASNKSEKYVFTGAPFLYQGIDWTGNEVNVSTKGTLHLDMFSPDVTSVKVSLIGGGAENGITKTVTPGSWNAIDIDMALFTSPDKTKIAQIKLEPNTGGTVYVDNIHFYGTAAAGGAGAGFAGGVFADDYVGALPSTSKSVQGGDVGFFYDARLSNTKVYDYGGVSGTAQDPAGVHNFYYGLGLSKPALTDAYFGAYVKSPGNATVDVSAFANLKLNVWGPDQQFGQLKGAAGSYPTLKAVLQGPAAAGCSTGSGGSEISATFNTTQQGAASVYTLPLSSFTLVAGCGGDTTVAQVLKHIAQVNVLMTGTAIQYTTPDTGTPPGYPNGLNIGSIKFN